MEPAFNPLELVLASGGTHVARGYTRKQPHLKALIREAIGASGQMGPAQLRDLFGLTRKFSIPLLEWLDGQGYTVRQGDVRVAGPRLTVGPEHS